MRFVLALAALGFAANAFGGDAVHYLDVVNTAPSSLVSFAVAPAGEAFRETTIESPVAGGGHAATVAIRASAGECLRDLRSTFADGRVLIQRGFDVCRNRTYHTGQYLRASRKP